MTVTLHVCSVAAFRAALERAVPPDTRQAGILEALSERPGRVWSSRELVDRLYGDDPGGGPDWGQSAVTGAVCHLRHRGYPIQTVGYRGYRIGGGA